MKWLSLSLCDPMDCCLPGSSIHGISQARVLEWVAISFSRGSSRSGDRTWVSHIVGTLFTIWDARGSKDGDLAWLSNVSHLRGEKQNRPKASWCHICWVTWRRVCSYSKCPHLPRPTESLKCIPTSWILTNCLLTLLCPSYKWQAAAAGSSLW